MKKVVIALISAVVILVGCEDKTNTEAQTNSATASSNISSEAKTDVTAKDSIDWQGVYIGEIPCDDCENIKATLTLLPDGKYTLVQSYDDADKTETTTQGNFTWDDTGSIITLVNSPEPNQYVVGIDMLTKLKFDGEKLDGEIATFDILKKQK